MKKVAVLGSGQVGETLGNGFLQHGFAVMRASREAAKLESWKKAAKGDAQIGTFADAATWGDIIVLAVKGTAAEAVLDQAGIANLAGKLVIDATNPIADQPPQNGVIVYFTNANESLMERLQKKVPAARFVKAFNSVGSAFMVNPKTGLGLIVGGVLMGVMRKMTTETTVKAALNKPAPTQAPPTEGP